MALKRKRTDTEPMSVPRSGLRPRIVKDGMRRAATRSKPQPLRDPFHVLGDHEIELIISHLDAKDTETLRRVSTLWKASSEYHCGRNMLLQHFPEMESKARDCESREEMNLLFRRCLYHQESLIAGLATRAIKCTGAYDWDLRDGILVWSNTEGQVSVRRLQSFNSEMSKKPESKHPNLLKRFPTAYRLQYVQPIPGGQLVTLEIHPSDNHSYSLRRQGLAKISTSGKIDWSIKIEASISRPAISHDFICVIHGPPGMDVSGNEYRRLSFQKISLDDGNILMDVDIPPANNTVHDYFRTINLDNRSLVLSHHERFAMWIDNCCGRYVLCTTTGKLMHSYASSHVRHPNDAAIPSSIHPGGFWDVHFPSSQLISYDEETETFEASDFTLPEDSQTIGYNGNHDLFCHIIHDKPLPNGKFNNFYHRGSSGKARCMDRFARLGVSSAIRKKNRTRTHRSSSSSLMRPGSNSIWPSKTPAGITLPGQGEGEERRDLTLKMPWKFCGHDYFGIVKRYLVYHDANDRVLVLVDFWPSW